MKNEASISKILFLKQTALIKHWFFELGEDIARRIGPVEMCSSLKKDTQIGNLKIHAAPPYKKESDLIRFWSWLKYFGIAAKQVLKSSRHTLLFIVSQPPFLPFLGYLSNVFRGQKYIIWVDDIFPDLIVRHNRLPENHVIIRWWKKFNNLIFSRAEIVYTLGPYMADLLKQYFQHPRCKVSECVLIPTWVDCDFIRPIDKKDNHFAKQYNQIDKITVLYSGNLGLSHDIETIIAAARQLQNRDDIHFMIIGHGAKWNKIKKEAAELRNLTLLPFQPEEIMPYSIAAGDITVVSLDKNFEGISMPSKTYYMMAAGTALISLSKAPNDLQEVIEENKCGVNVEPGNVAGLVKVVTRLVDDRRLLESAKKNARRNAVEKYSRPVNVEKVYQSLKHLLYE